MVEAREGSERSISTTGELLAESPALTLLAPSAGASSPMLRGLLGRGVVVLFDGIRLTTALSPLGADALLATVDPFSVERAEILRGASPVTAAADGIGGVIQLFSRRYRFDPWRAWDVGGSWLGRYGSADHRLVTHVEAEGHVRAFGARVGGTLRRHDELRSAAGAQRFSDYWEGDVDVSAAWYADRKTVLRLSYGAVRQHDVPQAGSSTPQDFSLLRDQLRDLVALSFQRQSDTFFLRELTATVSYQLQRQLRERVRPERDQLGRERDSVSSLGALLSARSEFPYNRLVYGADFYHDRVASTAEEERISEPLRTPLSRGRHVDGASSTRLAFFALDRVSLFDRRLAIDIGGRVTTLFTDVPTDPTGAPRFDDTRTGLSGSVHLRYLLGNGLNLHAGVTRGFRAPNIDDYTARGCSEQGFELAGPGLAAEKSVGAEAGVKLDLFGNLRGGISYFFTHIDDPIVRQRVPGGALQSCGGGLVPLTQRVNAPSARIHGVEGDLRLTLGAHWSLFAWVAWARGDVELPVGGTEPLTRVAPLGGLAGARYQAGDEWFIELAVRWATRQERLSELDLSDPRICPADSTSCRGTSGYALLGLRGGVRLVKPMRLLLAIENLTNQSYRIHGSALDGAGLDARLSLELRL